MQSRSPQVNVARPGCIAWTPRHHGLHCRRPCPGGARRLGAASSQGATATAPPTLSPSAAPAHSQLGPFQRRASEVSCRPYGTPAPSSVTELYYISFDQSLVADIILFFVLTNALINQFTFESEGRFGRHTFFFLPRIGSPFCVARRYDTWWVIFHVSANSSDR